jgi:hypothetical protein
MSRANNHVASLQRLSRPALLCQSRRLVKFHNVFHFLTVLGNLEIKVWMWVLEYEPLDNPSTFIVFF